MRREEERLPTSGRPAEADARPLSVSSSPTDEVALARFQSALAPIDVVRVTGRAAEVLDEEEGDEEPETPTVHPDAPYVPASDDPIDDPFVT